MNELLKRIMEENQRLLMQTTGTGMAQKSLLNEVNNLRGPIQDTQEAKNKVEVAKVKIAGAGELQTAEENRAAASAFGVNMDDVNSVVAETAAMAREATSRATQQAQTAMDKRNINFMEDPIGGIAALFTVPYHEAQAGREAQIALSAASRLTALNQAAQVQFKTNESLKRGVTNAAVENAVEGAIVAGNEALLKLREATMRSNINDLVSVLNLDKSGLDLLMQTYNIITDQERLQLARDSAAFQRTKWEAELKDIKLKESALRSLAANVNVGRAVYGLPAMSEAEILSYSQLGGKSKAMLDQWFDTGATKAATGVSSIATDPASAQVLLTQAGVRYPENDPRKVIQDFIIQSQRDFRATPQGAGATKAEEILGGTNKTAFDAAVKQAGNVKQNDLTNIYAAPPFATVVQNKAIQGTALYEALLKPQHEAGIVTITPNEITEQAAQLVFSKKLSLDQAVEGIVTYAKAVTAVNNSTKQYQAFGIQNQSTYKTSIKTTPGGQESLVDLTNATQVKAALFNYQMAATRNQIQERLRGFGMDGTPNPRAE